MAVGPLAHHVGHQSAIVVGGQHWRAVNGSARIDPMHPGVPGEDGVEQVSKRPGFWRSVEVVLPSHASARRIAQVMLISSATVVVTVTLHRLRLTQYIGIPISRMLPKNKTTYGMRMNGRAGRRHSTRQM